MTLLELRSRDKRPPFQSPAPHDLIDIGELELRVERGYGSPVVWDNKDLPLEQQLNRVAVRLLQSAGAEKESRSARTRSPAAPRESSRQAIARQPARQERASVKRLEDLVAAPTRHRHLVAFIVERREAVGELDPASELGRWLAWVDDYAQSVDVLRRFRTRPAEPDPVPLRVDLCGLWIVRDGCQYEGPSPRGRIRRCLPASSLRTCPWRERTAARCAS